MQNIHFITTQQYKKMYKKTHYFNTSYPKILTCNKKNITNSLTNVASSLTIQSREVER